SYISNGSSNIELITKTPGATSTRRSGQLAGSRSIIKVPSRRSYTLFRVIVI
ncbi:hypothetical protein TSAR_009491, partial [Trichomalopsis sarcophagae]